MMRCLLGRDHRVPRRGFAHPHRCVAPAVTRGMPVPGAELVADAHLSCGSDTHLPDNIIFQPIRSKAFAGFCPRQQYRSGASSPEEENATGGRVQGNEAETVLREAVGSCHKGEIGGNPPQAQARSQASGARRTDPRTEKASGRAPLWITASAKLGVTTV